MKPEPIKILLATLLLITLIALGCSGAGGNPTIPEGTYVNTLPKAVNTSNADSSHHLWGLWQFIANREKQTLDIIQLRTADLHLNALPFLEPPPLLYLTLETLEYHSGNIIETDIGLRHPFAGQTQFTGFDVCGIFITNGKVTGYGGGIVMAGPGDTRLLNPDGYSRWWNPSEFPINNGTIFSYTDGLLGAPDSYADYNCNLNAYKYFADALGKDDDISSIPTASRGQFSVGTKNIRHYTIELGSMGDIFNYAVDTCWKFPTGGPPWEAPDDFPPGANRPEPYRIDVSEAENTLYYEDADSSSGGSATLVVLVYDWFNPGENTLDCRSVCGIPAVTGITPVSTGAGFAIFQVTLDGSALTLNGDTNLLLICRSDKTGYQSILPGETISSYFTHSIHITDPTPTSGWARTWGGDQHDYGRDVVLDGAGNIYASGRYKGPVDFDPGPGTDVHAGKGAYLSKFDHSGNFLWARTWEADLANGVTVGNWGRVYVTGNFDDTVDFNPGPGVDEHTCHGHGDGYLSCFTPNGIYEWARTWGGTQSMEPYAVDTDGVGNVYVTGHFWETGDFDPGPGVEEITSWGEDDIFISKFTEDGVFQWARREGGLSEDYSRCITVDDVGNAYIAGRCSSSMLDRNSFLFKYDAAGTIKWGRVWGATEFDVCDARGNAVDNSGNIYVTGIFQGTTDFDPGPGVCERTTDAVCDTYLSMFNSDGDFITVLTWGGAYPTNCWGLGVDLDITGNIYVTGEFSHAVDFDPGPGLAFRITNGSNDGYLSKFNSIGELQWVRTWGAEEGDRGYKVCANNAGDAYVTGSFAKIVDFEPGPGEDNHMSYGISDAFLCKFRSDGYW